jgi:hypothetical protein
VFYEQLNKILPQRDCIARPRLPGAEHEKQVDRTAKTCGKCIRGLLCVKCNTWLGWMEKHGDRARAYLSQATA